MIYMILTYVILPLIGVVTIMAILHLKSTSVGAYRVICATHDDERMFLNLDNAYNCIPRDSSCRHTIRYTRIWK